MLLAASALAAPVAPHAFVLTQPDGMQFDATDWGDERASGVETINGFTIVLDTATGFWKYAERAASGALTPSTQIVGWEAPGGIAPHLRPTASGAEGGPPAPGPPPGGQGAPPLPGTHRLLVLLVEFTPAQSRGTTEADWEGFAFSGGIATAPDSLADYWGTVSYGQVTLVPAPETAGTADDGVVAVTLGTPHPDTAADDANRQLTKDALIAADPVVDYVAFDDDGNGYLDSNELHLLVVARGYERAYGGSGVCTGAGSVWAHHWSLDTSVPAPTLDGVVVGDTFGGPAPGPRQGGYNQIGEWHCRSGDSPGHMATLGVGAHEVGHDMGTGVPDLYDTDSSSQGIGRWALQAGGGWNTTGAYFGMTPAWPDAWSRWFLGFITPAQPPACAGDWPFPQIETALSGPAHGVVRLRDNPGGVDWEWGGSGTGEYFLVENRQQVGFDAAIPGAGLLIWHVDEAVPGDNSANADEGSCPPGNPRLVALEQADGKFDLECFGACGGACNNGDGGDAWAGGAFNGASTPSSDLYSGAATGVVVDDISASGATMTADLGYGPCTDGDACTSADGCAQGACAGTPYSCADGDVCTDDVCQGDGTCAFPDNTAACDDGVACTSGDACSAGACSGTPYACNDGDVCTDDVCQGDGTCAFPDNTAACDDGNACTSGDACAGGACAGTAYACDDGDACTDDVCQGDGTCAFPDNTAACDDGDACTSGDACVAGACAGTPYTCNDGDACTDDRCQGDGTCAFPDNTAACDDGDACTSGDTCAAGACAGTPSTCDDGNPCTADFCDGAGGCTTVNADGAACSNADPCAGAAQCLGGVCLTTLVVDCFTPDLCVLGTCDGAGGCVYTPLSGAPCDDGDPCSGGDTCDLGGCSGEPLTCDDGNPCTDDACGPGGCTNLVNTAPCDDGNVCTTGDQCSLGVCGGRPLTCDDGNACTDDVCAAGGCTHVANTDPCDDGNACTTSDACAAGVCSGGGYSCDDSDPCTEDSCDGQGGCDHTSTDCADGSTPTVSSQPGDGCGCVIGGRAADPAAPWLVALAAWIATRRRPASRAR